MFNQFTVERNRKKILGELRRERRMREWSLKEVAVKVGSRQDSLSNIENGKTELSLPMLMKLVDLYEMTLDQFFAKIELEDPRILSRIL